MFGLERTLGTRLVTYADDLVILCRRGKAEAALQRLREIFESMGEQRAKSSAASGRSSSGQSYAFFTVAR